MKALGPVVSSAWQSWGRLPRAAHRAWTVTWRDEPWPEAEARDTFLPYGMGRSYGDSCLNDGGWLLLTRGLDRWLAWDPATGVLRAEAGVSLEEVLALCVPDGWFLPVTPGTRYVTLGGAVANDVHGKNHHVAGTFGAHVRALELRRTDGVSVLTPERDPDRFAATIGGLGLTGLITWVELQMQPIEHPWMETETLRFSGLDGFFPLAERADGQGGSPYTVAWIDCAARGSALGRGLFMQGRHGTQASDRGRFSPGGQLPFPVDAPGWMLNAWSIRAFNVLYYHRVRGDCVRSVVPYLPFFYPLDAISNWNRMYGRQGFYQYQFVVPFSDGAAVVRAAMEIISASGQGSFLAVLKQFGDLPSPGMLSFPRPGYTLALDFSNRGQSTLALFERLDALVLEAGGALYPAKDARMPPSLFRASFPEWEAFSSWIDPRFSSSFWRRVTEDRPRSMEAT